jgi:secreted PhoX family phosphatase
MALRHGASLLLLACVLGAAGAVAARDFEGRQLLGIEDDNHGKHDDHCKGKMCDDEDHGDDVQTLSSEFKIIVRSGDVCKGCLDGKDLKWGQLFERDGKTPIFAISGAGSAGVANLSRPDVSNNPDFFSLLKVGKKVKAVVQFESPSPSMVYIADLETDKNGELSWTKFRNVDTSEYSGLQNTCAGSESPWGTHLGSEENAPNARALEAGYGFNDTAILPSGTFSGIYSTMRYFGVYPSTLTGAAFKKFYNPYNYGHVWELAIGKDNKERFQKIYSLPRVNSEIAYVMPDEKTVYVCDDASSGAFYKTVFDRPGDLTGMATLYAAKALQRPSTVGKVLGNFKITWVKMGRGNHKSLYKASRGLKFSDLFDTETPNPVNETAVLADCKAKGQCKFGCPTPGFVETTGDSNRECLRLKPGMRDIAAFLESRRMASYVGATSEFSKWEGITFDPKQRKIYTSISYQRQGMMDFANSDAPSGRYDLGGNNDVRLAHEECGGVYIMDVDKHYSAFNLYTMDALMGKTLNPGESAYKCAEDRIANPDNVNFIKDHATLVIGEDGDGHNANSAWAFNVNTAELTPILRSAEGGEVTGNFAWKDRASDKWDYQGIVVQHPSKEAAPVGYMRPFQLKKGQEIEFTPVAKRKRMSYMK